MSNLSKLKRQFKGAGSFDPTKVQPSRTLKNRLKKKSAKQLYMFQFQLNHQARNTPYVMRDDGTLSGEWAKAARKWQKEYVAAFLEIEARGGIKKLEMLAQLGSDE